MTNYSFTFHVASEGDTDDILDVETRAFGYSKEARLVADLLNDERLPDVIAAGQA